MQRVWELAERRSRLVDDTSRLLYADLHNHSLFSDGRGDPELAFAQLRAAGLDVAALTDHAAVPHADVPGLDLSHYPSERALALGRGAPHSIEPDQWDRLAVIADTHDVPGEFTAIRGFEWTDQWMGHVNVWLSHTYTKVMTPGSMHGLREHLRATEPDALFGYNHPGREPGRFEGFGLHADLRARMVGLELFNRSDDYLFSGFAEDGTSAVVGCLDAGWRPGVIGSSDEHGIAYGLVGKGRTGIWALEHSRAGVREALSARRTFATREVGFRLDATLDGIRLGGEVLSAGTEMRVDLGGSAYEGATVELQLLTGDPGTGLPQVSACGPAVVGEVTTLAVSLPQEAAWVFLRVADPVRRIGVPAPAGHAAAGWALGYASPWWLSQGNGSSS